MFKKVRRWMFVAKIRSRGHDDCGAREAPQKIVAALSLVMDGLPVHSILVLAVRPWLSCRHPRLPSGWRNGLFIDLRTPSTRWSFLLILTFPVGGPPGRFPPRAIASKAHLQAIEPA